MIVRRHMRPDTTDHHFTVEVRGAFNGVEEIGAAPMLFTPAHDKHRLAPISAPPVVRGAKPSDVVMIESRPLPGVRESETSGWAASAQGLTRSPIRRSGMDQPECWNPAEFFTSGVAVGGPSLGQVRPAGIADCSRIDTRGLFLFTRTALRESRGRA